MSSQPSKRKPRVHSRTQPVPMSKVIATLLLICLWAIFFGLVGGIILYFAGKLPSQVTGIVSGVYGIAIAILIPLTAFFGTIGSGKTVRSSFRRVWNNARHRLSPALGFVIATIVTLALAFSNQSPSGAVGAPLLQNTASPSTIATLTATKPPLLLKQVAPNCTNPKGTAWFVHIRGTFISCSKAHLLMQRISSQFYAGMELVEVNGSTYNQTSFHVQVQAAFQNPSDTTTLAALIVQTPAAATEVGGIYFVLSSTGKWQLQIIQTATDIPTVDSGVVSIDPSKPVLMAVTVNEGILGGYINGQLVVVYNDNLNPSPGQVGLYDLGAKLSSPVLYSNFELDV